MGSDQGRRAIVTGAASGIGRAVAQALVDAGAHVLAVDLEPDPAGPGEPFRADLTTRAANRAAVEHALASFGALDTIVANAGFQHVAPVAQFDSRSPTRRPCASSPTPAWA